MTRESNWLTGIREWMRTVPRLDLSTYETVPDPPPTRDLYHSGPSTPAPRRTDLAEVKAEVERVRREMAAERAAAATRRRARNEIAVAFQGVSNRPVPDGYAEGLKKLGLPKPLPMLRDDDGIPLPYETALQRR